jgi:hypothetical protein
MADPQRGNEKIALGEARILVSNDDGMEAPGLKLREEIAHALASDLTNIPVLAALGKVFG